jgi:hypothetical protein
VTDTYCFVHLQGAGNGTGELVRALAEHVVPDWRRRRILPWGTFRGLFGIASNELVVVAAAADELALEDFRAPLEGRATVLRSTLFRPTVRPERVTSREREGLYVFRFFRIQADDVAEFVSLSSDAWATFEHAQRYAAEPQGLFRQLDAEPDGTLDMLLVTWYDTLASWQTSRQPDPDARERFARRHALTRSTIALATALLPG